MALMLIILAPIVVIILHDRLLGGGRRSTHPTLRGKVVRVIDGDSVSIQVGGEVFESRIFGIDAPEYNQPHGAKSRIALTKLLVGRTVNITDQGRGHYGRWLVSISLDNGTDAAEFMIRNGHAWADEGSGYAHLQRSAQGVRAGLWSAISVTNPQSFRMANS